jgi:hypothetical protein
MEKRECPVSFAALIERTSHRAVSMLDQTLFHFHIECSPTSATLYIGGHECTPPQLTRIAEVIASLQRTTRVLRVDLHGVVSIDLQALMELRGMLSRWRAERNASVRLVLRTPLPRAEWPTTAIHFARAPLRLVATSRHAHAPDIASHRDRRADGGRTDAVRLSTPMGLSLSSTGAP